MFLPQLRSKVAFADSAKLLWVKDRLAVNNLLPWAAKELNANDIIVLAASANSFEDREYISNFNP